MQSAAIIIGKICYDYLLDLVCGVVATPDCFHNTGGKYKVVITEKGAAAAGNGIVKVTNNTNYEYELQSFTYANGAPSDYKVIKNGEIVPGASIFGAIVISAETPVSVAVNGAATSVNIPSNGVIFYCFAVKAGGEFNVVISPAA